MFDINSRELYADLSKGYEEIKEQLASGSIPPDRYQYVLGTLNAYRHFLMLVHQFGEKADAIRNERDRRGS